MILPISHGYQVQDDYDPFVQHAENSLLIFSKSTTQGAFLVDLLPFRGSQFHGTTVNTKYYIVRYVPE